MRGSIVRIGYVGLVSGACLADIGHDVVCVDVDRAKVERIHRGKIPIHEEGLDDLLRRHVERNLRATTDLRDAVLGTELTPVAFQALHELVEAMPAPPVVVDGRRVLDKTRFALYEGIGVS